MITLILIFALVALAAFFGGHLHKTAVAREVQQDAARDHFARHIDAHLTRV